jgi:short-subunit dehydrogenase
MITTTVNHFGGLDVLVLNHVIAGICHLENYVTSSPSSLSSSQTPLPATPNSSSTYDFPSIDQSFQVNVLALIKLTALALPHLRSSFSSSSSSSGKLPVVGIIAISSLASKMSFPGLSVYSSCKAAINAFFSCLRVELQTKTRQEGEREVTATTCCVGMTATEAALQHTSKKAQTRAISPGRT